MDGAGIDDERRNTAAGLSPVAFKMGRRRQRADG